MKNLFKNFKFTAKEKGDHLLEVLGTIIIAVVILIFFRSQIVGLFNGAINKTSAEVNNLFGNVVSEDVNGDNGGE